MKLEDQVCSLKLAKRLKELSVKQGESCFVYESRGLLLRREGELGKHAEFFIDALTVAELGEKLKGKSNFVNYVEKVDAWTWDHGICNGDYYTEANARAKMLIHLVEKGIAKN